MALSHTAEGFALHPNNQEAVSSERPWSQVHCLHHKRGGEAEQTDAEGNDEFISRNFKNEFGSLHFFR